MTAKTNYKDQIRELIKDPLLNTILPDISSMFSFVGNAASATAHLFNVSDKAKHFSDIFGVFGTKLFLFVNATINTLEQITRNNYLSAFGYFLDNIIAAVVPQEHTFLARGLSSGTYHLSYSLGIANGNKAKFNDFKDHNEHLGQALKNTFTNLFTQDFKSNFFKSGNALPGILGGFFSILGVIVWPLFGKKTATFMRDIGGSLKSTNYINPGHFVEGRRLYFLSGIMQCGAALADFCSSMFLKSKSYMVPISLGLDGMAKYILRQSVNKGELGEI
ncbi:MAG: hypothetical protein O2962_04585 [Cyanobacteria bacterium]|nr:hypothetical protein [Cyanobacteriota bacterium]